MYRVFRYSTYPQYWPSESTIYVDAAPGTVEEYITDADGVPKLVGNYIGTMTYANLASFPTVGKLNRMYIDGSTNYLYRWDGSSYVNLVTPSSGGVNKGTATASVTDVYTVSIAGVTSYTTNDMYVIKFATANVGGATLNISGLGAKSLVKNNNVPITGGDIQVGQEFLVVYDGTNLQMIGIAPNQMFAYVTNADSVTITKGQVVYAYGATGDRMSVKRALNTSDTTSAKTVGLVFSSSIAANGTGYIITQGVIQGLNLGSYTAGDTLYLDSVAGGFTKVKPHAPNHLVYVGIVERANAGNGQIYVRCQNGYELNEIHDVDLYSTPPSNLDVLTYQTGTNNLWVPKSISTILGYTPYNGTTNPNGYTTNLGTVTSVAQLTLGTSGTDLSSTVANGTTTPVITLNVPDASATARGALTSTDWSTFNSKQAALVGTGFVKSTAGTISYDTNTYLTANQTITLGGDLSGSGTTSITASIGANRVTNAMLVQAAANSILGNKTGSAANVAYLTSTEVTAMLDTFTSTLNGLTPASGGGTTKFLRADGNWAALAYTFSNGLTESAGTVTNNLFTGVAGGQSVVGGTAASNNLTLSSTSNATKGKIILGTLSAYDELNDRLGIGTTSPGSTLHVVTPSGTQQFAVITGTNTSTAAVATTCINLSATFSPTTNSGASYRTLNMSSTYNAPGINFTGAFGNNAGTLYVENRITSTGTITSLTSGYFVGMLCASQSIALGTVSTVAGTYTRAINSFSNFLTSTVSSAYGSYIAASVKLTLVVTSEAGQAIEEITAGTNNTNLLLGTGTIPTGNWSMYNSSTRANYINGNLLLGTTTNAGYKLDVNGTARFNGSSVFATAALALNATSGFIYIPTCAGTPTGVPATQTGTVATIYDTTNNKLYIYNGAWKSVTLA